MLLNTSAEVQASNNSTPSPVTFLENKGQWIDKILYEGKSTSTHIYLLNDGISFAQSTPGKIEDRIIQVWNMRFLNMNSKVKVHGNDSKKSVYSYLSGNDPAKWVIHPDLFKSIHYKNIFENIDLDFYGSGNDLKYDYIIHPGGALSSIRAAYDGVKKLEINEQGELVVTTAISQQVQKKPVAWQEISGMRIPVEIEYILSNEFTFGFSAVNGYNKNYDLIIDPLFQMVWASYTQAQGISNNINYCFSSTMDDDGNVYLVNMVDGTFPVTPGAYSGPGSIVPEINVAKFSPDGSTMIYSTYLPGNSSEHGSDIAVDDSGRAYVTGVIDLNFTGITNFPSTPNAYQPVHNTNSDAFLTVLNPLGTALVYSTFLGGTGSETGYGIALGSPNIVYIAGGLSGGNFPSINSNPFPSGGADAFVVKLDISQPGTNGLIYATRFGAGSFMSVQARGIAVNNAGNVFVTGTVQGSFGTPTFPITPGAYNNVYNTGQDNIMTFVTKLSSTTPVTMEYSTYLVPGTGNSIDVHEPTGDAFIVGSTFTFAFPVTPGALQPVHGGVNLADAFAIRLNAAGSSLIYSTFVGGPLHDQGTGVVINSAGEAYICGIAQDGFPTSAGSYQPLNAGSADFFVVNLNSTGTGYACGGSTYVGGSESDYSGNFYDYPSPHVSLRDYGGNNDTILVSSTSHSIDFPTTPGVYGPVKVNSGADQPVFFKLTCQLTAVPPAANFNYNILAGCDTVIVNFNDSTSNNPNSWQWSFPGAIPASSTDQDPQGILYTTSGSYDVILVVCNSSGCDTITQSLQITIPQNILINLGNDTLVCNGEQVNLSAPAGFLNYNWQLNGNPFDTTQSITAIQPGTYTVTVTGASGCSGTDTISVNINNPIVSAGADLTVCNGDSILINSTSGFSTYQWSLNGNALNIQTDSLYASQPGTYVVLATDSIGCSAIDSVVVTSSAPTVALGPDVFLCNNDSILVNATSGFTDYQWLLNGNPVGTQSSIYVSSPGTYVVIVTDSSGCINSDTIAVTAGNITVTLAADTAFCAGNSVVINPGSGFVTYEWMLNGNIIASSDTLVVNQSGDYQVTVTDVSGCEASDNIIITVNSLPQVQAVSDTVICGSGSVQLNVSGAINYQWSPVTYLSSTVIANPVSNPLADITYTVTGTDVNGCTGTDQVIVQVSKQPVASFDYSVDFSCNGLQLFTANKSTNAVNYLWDFGDGNISSEINPVHTYQLLQNQTLQLIAINGSCSDTAIVQNISYQVPVFNNIPDVLTPDGDGKNDCFEIKNIDSLASCFHISIFNRWGNLVYESSNTALCWDGKSDNGSDLPAAVYFYVITIRDEEFKGVVHLMR